MPFGFCNAPASFEILMEIVLRGSTEKKRFVYLDDVKVFSETLEERLKNVDEIFQQFQEAGLKLSVIP